MSDNANELLNNVLSITREQLSRYMGLATELEALLTIERQKNADLEAKIAELEQPAEEKKK